MRSFDQPGRSNVIAENGMAATSHPLATATALEILKDGGNAVDAAVAAAATLAVVEPHMTGIGGDCFAIVAEPDGKVHGLNGSGRAPKAARAAAYREKGLQAVPLTGALSVTVPGAVCAWDALLNRFGTLGFERLFADAIAYAENGFAVHERVAHDWAILVSDLRQDIGSAQHCLVNGAAPSAGSRFRFPALAQTLRSVAAGGASSFYEGAIAHDMATTVLGAGGYLTEDDLAGVTADWVDPIRVAYGGYEVLEIPPSGQGIVALVILNILNALGAGSLPHDSAERYHLEIEAARLAYALRDAHVADLTAMTASCDQLLSADYARSLAAKIDPDRRADDITLPPLPGSDTVYLTVVDRDRRAVSFINSLYGGFGAKLTTVKTGITLQNRGAGFSLEDGHPNELKGGLRPLHTIIPAMALQDGQPAIAFGVMGGAYQPMGHAHVFSNIADHGMMPQQAIDHPRVFWDDGGVILCESGVTQAARDGLAARGHTIGSASAAWGGAQMIRIDRESGFLIGGSDPRKDGLALGW